MIVTNTNAFEFMLKYFFIILCIVMLSIYNHLLHKKHHLLTIILNSGIDDAFI